MRGKGHGITPSSLYKQPKKRNPSNQEVMQSNQEVMQSIEQLKAQVRELQKDNERLMAENRGSVMKDTSDKASINCQKKFPEVISTFILIDIYLF